MTNRQLYWIGIYRVYMYVSHNSMRRGPRAPRVEQWNKLRFPEENNGRATCQIIYYTRRTERFAVRRLRRARARALPANPLSAARRPLNIFGRGRVYRRNAIKFGRRIASCRPGKNRRPAMISHRAARARPDRFASVWYTVRGRPAAAQYNYRRRTAPPLLTVARPPPPSRRKSLSHDR